MFYPHQRNFSLNLLNLEGDFTVKCLRNKKKSLTFKSLSNKTYAPGLQ